MPSPGIGSTTLTRARGAHRSSLSLLLLVLLAAATAGADVPAVPGLRAAVLNICPSPTADTAAHFAAMREAAADLDGDGDDEYIVQVSRRKTSDGSTVCWNEVFAPIKPKMDLQEVFAFTCCEIEMRGKTVFCKDTGKVALEHKGVWPTFSHARTIEQAKKSFDEGMKALNAKKFDTAISVLCTGTSFRCGGNLDYFNACATAQVAGGQLDNAQLVLDDIEKIDSRFAMAYLTQGRLSEKKGEREAAIRGYTRFLELMPQAPIRAGVEKQIAALKSGAAAGGAGKLPVVA